MGQERLASWDGQDWVTVISGPFNQLPGAPRPTIYALQQFQGNLILGGGFSDIGCASGSPYFTNANGLASWGCSDGCYADCDQSTGQGVLDIFDFLCFQSDFVFSNEDADCNQDCMLDIFDFLCFQNAFVGGCP